MKNKISDEEKQKFYHSFGAKSKKEFIIHYLIVVVLSIAIGLIYGYSFKANNKIGSITIGPNAIESTDNSVANTEN